ncbi:unnamed protein product [Urochloa humidicola]
MANIWAAVRWWDEWQMRILIAGSLFIQWFLLLAAPMRKYTIGKTLRILIWLAYISCDALAIYALATLFNRQAKASSPCHVGVKASSLEVLWAPVLLIHLGGREEITAYNIEDNELWIRQTVTLVSQVTVALYAFYKTWPSSSDSRLLWSAVLLFVVGVLSFCEKPWALKRASINRLVAVSSMAAGQRKEPTLWEKLFTELEIDEYTCGARGLCTKKSQPQDPTSSSDDSRPAAPSLSELDKVQMILSDMSLLAAATDLHSRGQSATNVLTHLEPGAEKNMKHWLRKAFGLIYTRANVLLTPAYLACHVLLVPSLHMAAIALFATSHKQAYKQFDATDVKMTYIVLCLTAVLDVLGLLISELVYLILSRTKIPALCETLPGHNLINEALQSKKLVWQLLNWVLSLCNIEFSSGSGGNGKDNVYLKVSGFVVAQLCESNQLRGLDFASYRSRTMEKNWILAKQGPAFFNYTNTNIQVWGALRGLPFDVSVIRWHIATDLCYRKSTCPDGPDKLVHRVCAVGISNYMAHLLNSKPEMLMVGSRQHLFTEAVGNVRCILDQAKLQKPDSNTLAEEIIRRGKAGSSRYPLVHDACMLAEELLGWTDESKRWKLMYSVWVGLLCYSASMCRGYLHAKSLGEGGEFLSFVSLVIALKGGKTMADKLQMPEHE